MTDAEIDLEALRVELNDLDERIDDGITALRGAKRKIESILSDLEDQEEDE